MKSFKRLFQRLPSVRRCALVAGVAAFGCAAALSGRHAGIQANWCGESVLQAAEQQKREIDQNEKNLTQTQEEIFQAIEKEISQFDFRNLDHELAAASRLSIAAGTLRQLAETLLAMHQRYTASVSKLHTSVTKGGVAFREAEKKFREYANEEPFKDLKEGYLELAESWATIAGVMEHRALSLMKEQAGADDMFAYLGQTGVFLKRLELHLVSYPDLSVGAERQRYLTQLKKYVEGFENIRRLVRSFHEELKKQAEKATQQTPIVKPEKSAIAPVTPEKGVPGVSKVEPGGDRGSAKK